MDFIVNNLPSALLIAGFAIESGMPPPSIPWGQMYLQKYGKLSPNFWEAIAPISQTTTTIIKYFIYLSGFSFFVLNFFDGILCNKSWNQPNGHKNPQISLPTITPKNINIPTI